MCRMYEYSEYSGTRLEYPHPSSEPSATEATPIGQLGLLFSSGVWVGGDYFPALQPYWGTADSHPSALKGAHWGDLAQGPQRAPPPAN